MQATTQTEVQQAATAALAADTLRGDVRDVLLNIVRGMEAPWSKLSERDQEWRIDAITKAAESVIQGGVRIIASQGLPHVEVLVANKGKYGGGQLEMTLTANFTAENATKLSDYGFGSAILVLAEPNAFFGERRIARAQPDQPVLPLDEAEREFTKSNAKARAKRETKATTPGEAMRDSTAAGDAFLKEQAAKGPRNALPGAPALGNALQRQTVSAE